MAQQSLDDRIKEKCFQVAEGILIEEPRLKIFLFGSRALGKESPESDFDLGIDAGHPIIPKKMVLLRDAFDNMPIFQKVDVVDFSQVDSGFKKLAMKKIVVFYEREIA